MDPHLRLLRRRIPGEALRRSLLPGPEALPAARLPGQAEAKLTRIGDPRFHSRCRQIVVKTQKGGPLREGGQLESLGMSVG